MTADPTEGPDLYPRPRRVDRHDPDRRLPAVPEPVLDESLPPQGYRLHETAEGIVLTHADAAGLRYGTQTRDQLLDPAGTLPAIDLVDWPDVAVRGYQLDISRDRVPTRATLAELVDVLARCRFNHLQLYVEHTFAYPGHEVVWADASPLDGDDLRWLDAFCHERGIELAVNQNTFGHHERWLRHDAYRSRAECPDGYELMPGLTMPAAVLAPTPANAAFAVDLVRQQLGCIRGRTANVGLDETFELGRGASRARCEEIGRPAVYLEQLRRIVEPLLADGCSVQIWGDVLEAHPELLADLPRGDLTVLAWSYERPDAPIPELPDAILDLLADIGIDLRADTAFAAHVAPFVAAGVPFWVAPGTSTWSSLVGRIDNARPNLLDAAETAVVSGAGGMLVTDWGDGGHHQPLVVSYPAIAYGGAVAWGVAANRDLDVTSLVDDLTGDTTGTLGATLDEVGRVWARTGVAGRNCSPLVAALLPHQVLLATGAPDGDAVAAVIDTLEQADAELARSRGGGADADLLEELSVAIGLARHGAIRQAVAIGARAEDRAGQGADLAELVGRYRRAWTTRSRPGGLDDSAGHLERTLATYRG